MAGKTHSHWPITLTNSTAALLGVFLPLVLVRILPPEEVGRYNIFFLYTNIMPALFLVGGLGSGLYYWAGKYPEARLEVRQSWTLLITLSVLLSLLGLLFLHQASTLIHIAPIDLQLVLLSVPLMIATGFLEDLMIARGNIWTGSLYSSGFNFFRIVSLMAAAWWTRKIEIVFGVFLAGSVLRLIVGRFLVDGKDIQWLFSREKVVSALRYAMPVSIAGLAGLGINQIDRLILSTRIDPAKFSFYVMGCLALPPLDIFETSVNRVLIPRLSQAFSNHDLSRASELFSEGLSELYRFLMPAAMGLALYAEPIVLILFTERYLQAIPFLRVYSLYYLFLAFPSTVVARARGEGRWILRTTITSALLSSAMTWYAAGRWGAMGALSAVLLGQLFLRLYSFSYIRQSLAASRTSFFPTRVLIRQTGIACVAGAISILLRPLFSDPRTWFFVTGPLFTVLYFGATYAIFLRQHWSATGPLRVVELAQTLGLGGLERTVYSLAHALNQDRRFKVLVATYDHPEGTPSLAPQLTSAGIPLVQWSKGDGFSFQTVLRLVRLLFSEETRIVHAHDLGPLIYGTFAKLLSFGRIRLVLTLHTLLDIQQNARRRFYYKVFLHFPDKIITVSDGVRAGLETLGVDPKRIVVIPNGVSFTNATRTSAATDKIALRKRLMPGLAADLYNARWLLCLARVHSGKGQDVLLKIWSSLPPETRAQLSLFFVGQETQSDYANLLRQQIQAGPDAHRVFLAGPSDRPNDWLQCSDVFVSGSLLEGMPLAPLEAAGAGLPLLLSDIEGHRFLKPWACYFDPVKPETAVEVILDMLKNSADDFSFEARWKAASPLRERWGMPSMTEAYGKLFSTFTLKGDLS